LSPRVLFWVHDREAPSFRHRLAAHIPALEAAGFSCEVETFPRRRYGLRVVERLRRLGEIDVLVVAKFKLETGERQLVRRAARRIVYDFDDAIYYSKPEQTGQPLDRSRRRVRKFERMCATADLVMAGNETLAAFARPHARRVAVVPTGIDLDRYEVRERGASREPRLVWIGLPGNLAYLKLVERPLVELAEEFPALKLRVISERPPAGFAAPFEFVAWSEESEAAEIAAADIGIMPLTDDDWTRGKGGFKLLQYMAAGLPAVASPVGVNREIVVDNETGLLARGAEDWRACLRTLLADPELRRRMGRAGRRRVEERYERSIVSRRIVELFREL
jgi:glycosyltransferase involved in cell wall biosynthesis